MQGGIEKNAYLRIGELWGLVFGRYKNNCKFVNSLLQFLFSCGKMNLPNKLNILKRGIFPFKGEGYSFFVFMELSVFCKYKFREIP